MEKKQNQNNMAVLKSILSTASLFISGSGILYAAGYLAQRANFKMLGILDVPFENQHYIEIGGYFFFKTLVSLLIIPLNILSLIYINRWLVVAIPLLILFTLLKRRGIRIDKISANKILLKKKEVMKFLLIVSIYLLAITSMLKWTFPFFIKPQLISGTIFHYGPQLNKTLVKTIINANSFELIRLYSQYVSIFILLIIVLLYLRSINMKFENVAKFRKPLQILFWLFLVIVFIHGLFLPMNYGVLLSSTTYSVVNIDFPNDSTISGRYLLLSQNLSNIGLYDQTKHEVIIIQKKDIKKITIIGETSIFVE